MRARLGYIAAFLAVTVLASLSAAPFCSNARADITPGGFLALNTISSVTRLDLSDGKIAGDKASYTLNIPQIWAGYLIADREKLINSADLLEKINFYYQPQANYAKPVFLMSFFVFSTGGWADTNADGYMKILTSVNNVFAAKSTSDNPFTNETDKALFSRFIADASNADFIYKMISLPPENKEIANNQIRVNGSLVKGAASIAKNGVVYVPVRKVCEFMGYNVNWLAASRAVTVSGRGAYVVFLAYTPKFNQGFSVMLVNGTTYVSSMFFVQKLNSSLEIDDSDNVLITNR